MSGLVDFKDIDEPADLWAECVENHLEAGYQREDMSRVIRDAGFDVKEQATRLERFYLTGKMAQER